MKFQYVLVIQNAGEHLTKADVTIHSTLAAACAAASYDLPEPIDGARADFQNGAWHLADDDMVVVIFRR